MPEVLATVENTRLSDLENQIERGLTTFVEVGLALLEIRDAKLYRASHAAFEDYCRGRWQMSRIRAHQMIEAAATVKNFEQSDAPPAVESHVRELSKLETADAQRAAWAEVVDAAPKDDAGKPKVTAKDVQRVVAKRKTPSPPKAVKTETVSVLKPAEAAVIAVAAKADAAAADAPSSEPWTEWAKKAKTETHAIHLAATNLAKLIGVEKEGHTKSPFAYFLPSNDSTLSLIREGLNNIVDNLPAGASDRQPGFIPLRVARMKKTLAKKGAA